MGIDTFWRMNDTKCAYLYEVGRQQGTMYGMLLESVQHYVQLVYGEDCWLRVLEHAQHKNVVFATHKRYSDGIMVNIATACSQVMKDRTPEDYMGFFGQCFVDYFTHYGYDKIVRVAGRHYRDFLNGIDNLHETMRFSYPKMLSPSFFVDGEDSCGCNLHYRSKRSGFTHYVIGQLKQCGKKFYSVDVTVTVVQEVRTEQGIHVVFRLDFDNWAYQTRRASFVTAGLQEYPTITMTTFFKVFPFSLVFNKELIITHVGDTLNQLFSSTHLQGSKLDEHFYLRRPQVQLAWENVLCLQKVVFELESILLVRHPDVRANHDSSDDLVEVKATRSLLLKGQMRYMKDLQGIAFLCNPMLSNLEELEALGLYINDLNMHDSSRGMVMAGWQHASRLEYSIEKQIEKSKQIAMNMAKLDEWRQKSNELLYSMIPQTIAVRLKNGEDPINTCEMFDQVTIMFCYMIGFTDICAQAGVLDLVKCINSVFMVFDAVVEKHSVFKVETLGDAVYMVAGGVPDRRPNHAVLTAHVALELIDKARQINSPIMKDKDLAIRIGMHTGSVVAGVVGKRMPQYCLFGDTVNTASRMQTYSEPGRIHISEPCQKLLKHSNFVTVFRGRVDVKGKGQMNTYWLAGLTDTPKIQDIVTELRQEQTRLLSKNPTRKLLPDGSMFDLRLQTRRQSEASLFELAMPRQSQYIGGRRAGSKFQLGRMGTSEIVESTYREQDESESETDDRTKRESSEDSEGELGFITFSARSQTKFAQEISPNITEEPKPLVLPLVGPAGGKPAEWSGKASTSTRLDQSEEPHHTPPGQGQDVTTIITGTENSSIMTKSWEQEVQDFLEKSQTWENVQQAINDLRRQLPKVSSTGDLPNHKGVLQTYTRRSLPAQMRFFRRRDSLPVPLGEDPRPFKEKCRPKIPKKESTNPGWFQDLPEESGNREVVQCPQLGPSLDQALWKDLLSPPRDTQQNHWGELTVSLPKSCSPLDDGQPKSEGTETCTRAVCPIMSNTSTSICTIPRCSIGLDSQIECDTGTDVHTLSTSSIICTAESLNVPGVQPHTINCLQHHRSEKTPRDPDKKEKSALKKHLPVTDSPNWACRQGEEVFLFDPDDPSVGDTSSSPPQAHGITGSTIKSSTCISLNELPEDGIPSTIKLLALEDILEDSSEKLPSINMDAANNTHRVRGRFKKQSSFEEKGSLLLNGYLGNNFVDDSVTPLSQSPAERGGSGRVLSNPYFPEVVPTPRVRASTVSARPIPQQPLSHHDLQMSRCESAFAYLHSLGGHSEDFSPSSSTSSLSRKFQSQSDVSSPIDIIATGRRSSAGPITGHPSPAAESQSPASANFFIGSPDESPLGAMYCFNYHLSSPPLEGATAHWTSYSPPGQPSSLRHWVGTPLSGHLQLSERKPVLKRLQEHKAENDNSSNKHSSLPGEHKS